MRARAALAALLCAVALASTARADVLVIRAPDDNSDPPYSSSAIETEAMIRGILGRSAEHVYYQNAQYVATEWARTGVTPWGTVQAVIHIVGINSSVNCGVGVCMDSLHLYNRLPTVPQLYVSNGQTYGSSSEDSSGALPTANEVQSGYSIGATMYTPGTDAAFRTNSNSGIVLHSLEGGLRVLLAQNLNGAFRYSVKPNPTSACLPCVDCDSTVRTNGDTARVWVRLNSHVTGAKQEVFCSMAHQSNNEDSPEILWLAMAYLDSVAGRRVLGAGWRPAKIGFQIRGGGAARNALSFGGGMVSDSTILKAGIDSLAALRIPFSVGFPADSLALGTVAQQLSWWVLRAPLAHFAPYSLTAITDSTIGGSASATSPVDIFGRYRKRAAYGDGTATGSDSSMWALLSGSYTLLTARVGERRIDHALMPPDDDWSPIDYPTMTTDSLFAFLYAAGARSVVANIRERTSNPTWSRTNPRGWYAESRAVRLAVGANVGKTFYVLSTPGYADSGSARFENGTAPSDGDKRWPTSDRQSFFWNGVTGGKTLVKRASPNGIMRALPDSSDSRVQIYTIHVGDLGTGVHASGRPMRPGWWQIKNITNAIRLMNQFGRAMIEIAYPEAVQP